MAENGFPRVIRHGHRGSQAGNGRKWPKMAENGGKKVHRDYLVGNGFPRVIRHSPTTRVYSNRLHHPYSNNRLKLNENYEQSKLLRTKDNVNIA